MIGTVTSWDQRTGFGLLLAEDGRHIPFDRVRLIRSGLYVAAVADKFEFRIDGTGLAAQMSYASYRGVVENVSSNGTGTINSPMLQQLAHFDRSADIVLAVGDAVTFDGVERARLRPHEIASNGGLSEHLRAFGISKQEKA
jgi:hypothetical protein